MSKRTPIAIQRLIDEVRQEGQGPAAYDRAHNRHNRSYTAPREDPKPVPTPPPAPDGKDTEVA
jgi:hypothetical protein